MSSAEPAKKKVSEKDHLRYGLSLPSTESEDRIQHCLNRLRRVDDCRVIGISLRPQTMLPQIDKLKAEIARLEQEALNELKAKREALIVEIAAIDQQIAALASAAGISPRAKTRPPKEPVEPTSHRECEMAATGVHANGHSISRDDSDCGDELLPEANPQRSNSVAPQDQSDAATFSKDSPVFTPRIPVRGKSPHPVGFSYPLGASAMSEALAGLPMFDRFTLHYSNRTPIFTMAQPLRGFPMLRITYTNYPVYESRGSTHRFQGGERWAIEVLPTPFDHREFIQKVILEQAVPLLRDWFTGPDLPGSDIRRMAKACWYVVETRLVKWIEEDEARLVTG